MSTIRVMMIGEYPLDPTVMPGGVTAVAHHLVKGLARQPEIDLHMVCCQPEVARDQTTERDGATIHFLNSAGRFNQLTNWARQRRKIARLAGRVQPDIVHGQGLGLPAAVALTLGRPFGIALHGVIWRETHLDHPS